MHVNAAHRLGAGSSSLTCERSPWVLFACLLVFRLVVGFFSLASGVSMWSFPDKGKGMQKYINSHIHTSFHCFFEGFFGVPPPRFLLVPSMY